MFLFTNGCSWTWGGGLNWPDENARQQWVWPHDLGHMLNASHVVNLSDGCGSNQRIMRTTLDYFMKFSGTESFTAIIQFTDPFRFEFYDTDKINDWTNKDDLWIKITNQSVVRASAKFELAKRLLSRYLETYTDVEGMYRLMTQTLALVKLFEKYNAKYYFWHPFCTLNFYPEIYRNFFLQFPTIDPKCKFIYDRISTDDPHPSTLGHKQIAELIYNDIIFLANPSDHKDFSYKC